MPFVMRVERRIWWCQKQTDPTRSSLRASVTESRAVSVEARLVVVQEVGLFEKGRELVEESSQ